MLRGALTPRKTQADGDEACEIAGNNNEVERAHACLERCGVDPSLAPGPRVWARSPITGEDLFEVPGAGRNEVADAIAWLGRHGFTVYLADTEDSDNYRGCDFAGRTALVVGSERYGISPPWHAGGFRRVGIPMLGSADSLNVAVSAAVLLYEARAQMSKW